MEDEVDSVVRLEEEESMLLESCAYCFHSIRRYSERTARFLHRVLLCVMHA